VSEPQFSRLTTGVQAFGLAHLDQLPRDLRVEFYRRLHESDDGADLTTRLAGRLAHAAIDFLSHAKKSMAHAVLTDELNPARKGAPSQKEE
jgi:hypothetical protein